MENTVFTDTNLAETFKAIDAAMILMADELDSVKARVASLETDKDDLSERVKELERQSDNERTYRMEQSER